jgi:hypothetical protein
MKRLTNQSFTSIWSIRIRRVDEVDAELDRTAQECDGFRSISWLAPHAGACQLHRTEAQPVNAKIATDRERAAPYGRFLVSVYRRSWFSRSHVVLNSLDTPAHVCTFFSVS